MTTEDRGAAPDVTPLVSIASGFFAANVLAAAIELDLFTTLSVPRTTSQVLEKTGMSPLRGRLFLDACVELGLLLRDDDSRYRDSPVASGFLLPGPSCYFGNFGSLLSRPAHLPWHRLTELLRSDECRARPPAAGAAAAWDDPTAALVRTFWPAVRPVSEEAGHALGRVVDFGGVRRLLDVAGGSAPYTIALCTDHPHLHATVYEMPWVGDLAGARIAEAGLAGRITVATGDFLVDELPSGYDGALVASVLHSWAPDAAAALLRKIHRALSPGGLVVLVAPLHEPDDDEPGSALVRLAMELETTAGPAYSTVDQLRALAQAGFVDATVRRLPGRRVGTDVVTAFR
ncbi:methyltransferase [Amycolatopsis sp. NPDC005003]